MGWVTAAQGPRCPTACGILVPRPGIKPEPTALESRFLTPRPPGKCPGSVMAVFQGVCPVKLLGPRQTEALHLPLPPAQHSLRAIHPEV